jgi:hypothetical protein
VLFDLLSLDLVFLALRYQPGFGPLAVAYGAANIANAIPVTPGGLGVIEVTMVAITVGFGTPRPTAVLAVIGYRIVNYWLPLIPGAVAYLRLRLRRNTGHGPGPADPSHRSPGRLRHAARIHLAPAPDTEDVIPSRSRPSAHVHGGSAKAERSSS